MSTNFHPNFHLNVHTTPLGEALITGPLRTQLMATSYTTSSHRSSLAHVPAGQRLRDVESLPNIRVVEVGGGGCGVGAWRIQAYLVPRPKQ